MSEGGAPIEFDVVEHHAPGPKRGDGDNGRPRRLTIPIVVAFAVVIVSFGGFLWVSSSNADHEQGDEAAAAAVTEALPGPLRAAVRFRVEPSGDALRDLLASVGGLEALIVGETTGSFDVVGFDPLDDRRLLASHRSSYGAAQNQDTNEQWIVGDAGVAHTLWAPTESHDFVGYNADGTTTMWVHGGGTGFAPRVAQTTTRDGVSTSTTDPMYASRWAVASGIVFALTGNGDYYTQDTDYVDLVADDGVTRTRLGAGGEYGWIDIPAPGVLVAYADSVTGTTDVWNVATLERLDDHPFAVRSDQRLAISGDGSAVLAVSSAGLLERVDPDTGATIGQLGQVSIAGVDRPLTLSHDGTIAVIVETAGRVTMRWVGDGTTIAEMSGDSAQPRWLSSDYSARSTSVVSAGATRVALRLPADPERSVRWSIIDLDVGVWVEEACRLAGRSLAPDEIASLDLDPDNIPCR